MQPMNPRILAVPVLAAALTACLWFIPWTESHVSVGRLTVPADPGGTAKALETGGKNPSSENSTAIAGKKPAMNWKRLAALGNSDNAGAPLPQVTPEDVARFLAKRGETAVNLVAAYGATHDRRLLERALELFPSSPIVLMAAIESIPAGAAPKPGETYQPDAERPAFIERFKAADPNNPLPWIYSAQELFKAGPNAGAIADIRAALERPAFYTYSTERMDAAHQIYEDTGMNPTEAGLLAMAGLTLPHMSAATQISRTLTEWQKSAADSGDTAAANDALRLTYDLGRTFATPEASRTLIGQLVGISMEARALKALPADAWPDWLAVAPAQRLADMEAQKQNVRDLTINVDWLLQQQDEQLLAEYLRRNRTEGEYSALTWLKAQKK